MARRPGPALELVDKRYRRRRSPRTSWIVDDACQRLYHDVGRLRWDQWKTVARDLGLQVRIIEDGPVPPACLVDRIIIIRAGFDAPTTAYLVFHEIGHAVLHAGTPDQWRAMPNGIHLLRKFERQAHEFAEAYPVWEPRSAEKKGQPR